MEIKEIEQSIKKIEETKKLIIEKVNHKTDIEEKITLINKMKELDIGLNEYKKILLKKSKYII